MSDDVEILWAPAADAAERTQIGDFMRWVERERGTSLPGYDELWRWSVDDVDGFWSALWAWSGLVGKGSSEPVRVGDDMAATDWFPNLRLNWAENVLQRAPHDLAVVSRSQTRDEVLLTGTDLHDQVARARAGLVRLGVQRGDRVVAYLPNISEALVVLLAAASLGAVFSSCPPEFGIKAVVDRFGQITPTVLVAADGYRHRGKAIDRRAEVQAIRDAVPSIEHVVLLPYLDPDATVDGAVPWASLTAEPDELTFDRVPFDHPLYVLYSSGTTGRPKPIVHGHGGILVEHTKSLRLHHDLGPGDRFFWFSTTGWMMWNYVVSGLLSGATIVLHDGDPGYPDLGSLWSLVDELGVTVFGASAPFLLACRKAGLRPGDEHDLSRLRQLGCTGAPLPAEGFRWVFDAVGSDLLLATISGGTDVCCAFVGASPLSPVIAGEMSVRCLAVKVEAWDDDGRPVVGEQGELVVTEPMPSMPVGFWGDDGSRYRAAYFERFDGVWAHGDWITLSERGTSVISGRSDATLNRGGVRLGTSDFYSVVEELPEVADSLVVHLEDPEGGLGELVLFVQTGDETVGDDLRSRICSELRTALSPRHVPDRIVAVPAIPRTASGKKLEVPVKRLLRGADPATVASRDSLADPTALDAFVALAASRTPT